jgi:hypothetical protein
MGAPGKVTNYPNGVSSFGWVVTPASYAAQAWGGGATLWVGNRSGLPAGDGSTPDRPLSALFGTSGGLAKVNNRVGVTICILPGHVESITASTSISGLTGTSATGLNIIGLGYGSQRPLFNWTAAASALLQNIAGCWIRNCVFNFSSTAATVVTAALTVSAADCGLDAVEIKPATSATQLTTTGITVASGATKYTLLGVEVVSETFATNPTDILTTTAAVDKLTMYGCRFHTAVNSTTNGVINLANAPTNVWIEDCTFNNKKASSTIACIASANTTGAVNFCNLTIQAATGGATCFGTPGNLTWGQTRGSVIGKAAVDLTPQSG